MSNEQPTDSPTHRLHILQMKLPQFKEDLIAIRVRRGLILEKVTKAKANSKIEREATANKQLKRVFSRLEKKIASLDEDMATIEDDMNKARSLILELSDGEVLIPKTEIPNGDA